MRAVYPAWAHMMPAASYRHNIFVLLVAAVVGAISSATVVLFLVGEPSSATGIPSTSVRLAVMREPAATDRAAHARRVAVRADATAKDRGNAEVSSR